MKKKTVNMESKTLLESFVAYCKANPSLRFWQALRNWSGASLITYHRPGGPIRDTWRDSPTEGEDTFFWRGKEGIL